MADVNCIRPNFDKEVRSNANSEYLKKQSKDIPIISAGIGLVLGGLIGKVPGAAIGGLGGYLIGEKLSDIKAQNFADQDAGKLGTLPPEEVCTTYERELSEKKLDVIN